MDRKIRVGLVGAGAVAQIGYLPVIQEMEDLTLEAVCESDCEKVEILSTRYSVENVYTDYERMLRDADIDVVVIATPNYLHTPMAISAIEYGKDVLCEMPLGLDADEIRDLGEVVEKSDNILMAAFSGRFRPDVQILKEIILSGELGHLSFAKAGWLKSLHEEKDSWRMDPLKSGGGAIITLGVQILGYVSWLVGLDVVSVVAGFHTTDKIEDSGIIFLRYHDGSYMIIEVGWTLLFEKDFTYFNLYGADGVALLNPLKIKKIEEGKVIDITPGIVPKHPIKASYHNMMKKFVEYYKSRDVLYHGWKDAMEVSRIIDAAYRSAEEEKEILL